MAGGYPGVTLEVGSSVPCGIRISRAFTTPSHRKFGVARSSPRRRRRSARAGARRVTRAGFTRLPSARRRVHSGQPVKKSVCHLPPPQCYKARGRPAGAPLGAPRGGGGGIGGIGGGGGWSSSATASPRHPTSPRRHPVDALERRANASHYALRGGGGAMGAAAASRRRDDEYGGAAARREEEEAEEEEEDLAWRRRDAEQARAMGRMDRIQVQRTTLYYITLPYLTLPYLT